MLLRSQGLHFHWLVHHSSMKDQKMEKKNLFEEIVEGFNGLSDQRAGEQTLRTHKVEMRPAPEISAFEVDVGKCAATLHVS